MISNPDYMNRLHDINEAWRRADLALAKEDYLTAQANLEEVISLSDNRLQIELAYAKLQQLKALLPGTSFLQKIRFAFGWKS